MPKAAVRFRIRLITALMAGGHRKAYVCKKTGISRSQLDSYLKGTSVPGLDNAEALSEAVGIHISELLKPVGDPIKEHALEDCIEQVTQAARRGAKFVKGEEP